MISRIASSARRSSVSWVVWAGWVAQGWSQLAYLSTRIPTSRPNVLRPTSTGARSFSLRYPHLPRRRRNGKRRATRQTCPLLRLIFPSLIILFHLICSAQPYPALRHLSESLPRISPERTPGHSNTRPVTLLILPAAVSHPGCCFSGEWRENILGGMGCSHLGGWVVCRWALFGDESWGTGRACCPLWGVWAWMVMAGDHESVSSALRAGRGARVRTCLCGHERFSVLERMEGDGQDVVRPLGWA